MPQWLKDLIGNKPPTADTLRGVEPQLNQQGWQLIWNATGQRADIVSPDGMQYDIIDRQGGSNPAWVGGFNSMGPAPRGSGSTKWSPLPGYEGQASGTNRTNPGSGGGTDRQATQPINQADAAGRDPRLSTGVGGNLEKWTTANPIQQTGGGGTVGDMTAELHGTPAPLPGGYTMDETRGKIGSQEFPLSSIGAPGLAKPWTASFDPTVDPTTMSPGYDFRRKEGADAIERQAAASGTLLTGGTVKDLTRWGQDYATAEYEKLYDRMLGEYGTAYDVYKQNQSDIYNKLAGMSGTGQVSAADLASAGTAYADRAGDLGTQGANAQAAGIVGGANAKNSFLGTIGDLGTNIVGYYGTQPQVTTDPYAVGAPYSS